MSDILDQAKALLTSRKRAYGITFSLENQNAKAVLKDLAEFCRANQTTFSADERVHAVLEGRREVWLRIQKYLNLNPEQLWDLSRKD